MSTFFRGAAQLSADAWPRRITAALAVVTGGVLAWAAAVPAASATYDTRPPGRIPAGSGPRPRSRPGRTRQAGGRQGAVRSAWSAPCAGRRAHTGYMGRMIWTILGVILAIWVAVTAIGWISATLRTFLVTGLIAGVVVIVVSLLARLPRRG